MQPIRDFSNPAEPANDGDAHRSRWRSESVAPLWRILSISGYGLWSWLGLALALGFYPAGRNGTLLPLSVGTAMVGIGLLVACLPWRGATDWYGWRPRRDSRPTHAAMLALLTFLPMLAVAGLARGDNVFWATRMAGAVLSLSCVASLAFTGYRYQQQLSSAAQRAVTSMPVNRLVFAGYAGGLWLWLSILVHGEPVSLLGSYPWILLLLAFALLLGLLESMDWESLARSESHARASHDRGLTPARFVAAFFTYVVPCVSLLVARSEGLDLIAAAVAVPSCLLGKWLERHLYESLLAHEQVDE
jgi:hypothetical protein